MPLCAVLALLLAKGVADLAGLLPNKVGALVRGC